MAVDSFKVKKSLNLEPGTATVDSAGDIRYNNSTNVVEYRDNAATRAVVSTDGTQTLTNKTLNGNTATNLVSGSGTLTLNTSGTITVPNGTDTLVGKATSDTLTNKTLTAPSTDIINFDDQASAPSNPSAGNYKMYFKTDGQLYKLNSSGTETQLNSDLMDSSVDLKNISLTCSVGSNALTIALKTKAGTDPSSTDPVKIGFRNSTLTNGTYSVVSATAATSLVVSSGSTLGTASTKTHNLFIYAINNAGAIELAISQTLFAENILASTTAEGGAGAADSNRTVYSTTARTGVPIRVIGMIVSTQTTAGTWAAVPSTVHTGGFGTVAGAETVAFKAQGTPTGTLSAAYNDITWASAVYDTKNSWNGTTTYTAPVTGFYHISAIIQVNGTFAVDQQLSIKAVIAGADAEVNGVRAGGAVSNLICDMNFYGYLQAGDTVKLQSYCDATTPTYVALARLHTFSVVKIGSY